MSKGLVFINGKFVPLQKAGIPVTDMAVQRGYCVFEVLRTGHGAPFEMPAHLRRMQTSARLLGVRGVPSSAAMARIIRQGIKKIRGEALVKILLTGGSGGQLVPGRPLVAAVFLPLPAWPARDYARGIGLMTTNLPRVMPAAKSTNYLTAVLGQLEARKKGFQEALYVSGGKILEGGTFNVALVKGRELIVPQKGVLRGITMEVAVRAARRIGLRVTRRDVKYAELRTADEMISASTTRDIVPVARVDKIVIGSGQPGKYAKMLLEEFRRYVERYQDKN